MKKITIYSETSFALWFCCDVRPKVVLWFKKKKRKQIVKLKVHKKKLLSFVVLLTRAAMECSRNVCIWLFLNEIENLIEQLSFGWFLIVKHDEWTSLFSYSFRFFLSIAIIITLDIMIGVISSKQHSNRFGFYAVFFQDFFFTLNHFRYAIIVSVDFLWIK